MAEIRATGGATSEVSYYDALQTLLDTVGRALRPRVICNGQLRNQGAGHPDFGLYTATQCRGGAPVPGQGEIPERGVVEVKGLADQTWVTAETAQVSRYWRRYRLVLVSNYRDFALVGVDEAGRPVRLEGFQLAPTDAAFWEACRRPRATARQKAGPFVEYLKRALSHLAPLTRPADLAWLLASYARDALARVEASATLPALATVRAGLEQAVGLRFEDQKGEHFFRSTLVQTLFYGVFAAWVQWCREQPAGSAARFDWRTAGWSLHVPMIRNLFGQIATPSQLGPLDLVEVLDWTGAALNRVDRAAFFAAFDDRLAVQYFYEPFLAAYDPELRKDLGVWYTPPEIVRYMVARVDAVLRSELGVPDGLADPRVYVLDPCCGTGSFLAETLDLIGRRLHEQGGDALVAQDLKRAARERVFGFEIMPAPFVIAHWQLGLLLAAAGAPLTGANERAAVYLTNALTGWQAPAGPPQPLLLPELEPERDAAEHVKREVPILVVIGNPPYNAFAGTSPAEEEGLVEPYKTGLQREWGIRKFNLDDLYVRFFRIAERRIASMTGRGVMSFITNYSWTERESFVVMRQLLLQSFDRIWIENMHGNRVITEYAPDGQTSETIFAQQGLSVGIQQGVTISTLVRTGEPGASVVRYRDDLDEARAADRRAALVASLDDPAFEKHYQIASPTAANRFNLRPQRVGADYAAWPSLRELADAEPFSGLSEKRKGALIALDRAELAARMRRYLDPAAAFHTVRAEGVGPVEDAAAFRAEKARHELLRREVFSDARLMRYAMYPLDQRWCYHTVAPGIWNRARPEFASQVCDSNLFLVSRMAARRPEEGLPMVPTRALANHHLLDPNAHALAVRIFHQGSAQASLLDKSPPSRANLSSRARSWLNAIGWPDPDEERPAGDAPWQHTLAVGCSPQWLSENRAAILAGWPRVPLPRDAERLRASAALGARLADLLDPDWPVAGVAAGALEPPFAVLGVVSRAGAGQLDAGDLALSAGWSHRGQGGAVMPGRGRVTERDAWTGDETAAIAAAAAARGEPVEELRRRMGPPVDVWLNEVAYWRGVPRSVWDFTIGGYQVLKKWLSYRECQVLGRPLTTAEAREATAIVRRLAAVVLMQPELDASYRAIRAEPFPFDRPSAP